MTMDGARAAEEEEWTSPPGTLVNIIYEILASGKNACVIVYRGCKDRRKYLI